VGSSELDDVTQVNALFADLLAEAQQYLPRDEVQTFLWGAYGQLMSSLAPGMGFSDPTVYLSVDIALHAARLSLPAPYLASSLVFHPVLAGRLSQGQVESQFRRRSAPGEFAAGEIRRPRKSRRRRARSSNPIGPETELLEALNSLIALAQGFEPYLPWVQESAVVARYSPWPGPNTRTDRNSLADADKEAPTIETLAFIGISGTPFVAILKVLDRHRLLADLERFANGENLRRTIAAGTLDVFAPVAEALGLWTIKSQMEDACLKILEPQVYSAIADDLRERLAERLARTERAIGAIRDVLSSEGLTATFTGRPKHIYGLNRKVRQGMKISEVNDALGVRIVARSEEDCYAALGLLARHFGLAAGLYEDGKLYRDWIAHPKPNGYQSIHATVEFEHRPLEVQIRTQSMHDVAEYGIAAHWVYRAAGNSPEQQRKYEPYVGEIAKARRLVEATQRTGARGREKYWIAKNSRSKPEEP
jgi:ppGpp synthetase/RelA/SpoT-type nucleotidyltranferase